MSEPRPQPEYNPYAPPAFVATPPPERSSPQNLADRSTRFAGRVIDNLLFGLSLSPLLAGVFLGQNDPWWYATGIVPLLFAAYQSYLVATTGQSVAKRWLGLMIVRTDGERAGFLMGVVVREWVVLMLGFVPILGMLFRLADSLLIFGEERRCLHDYLAGTQVVVSPSATAEQARRAP